MSFGIEFDADVDDENQVEKHDEAPEAEVEPSGSRYSNLFKLTDSLRKADRERWMRRYANLRIPSHQNPADACDENDRSFGSDALEEIPAGEPAWEAETASDHPSWHETESKDEDAGQLVEVVLSAEATPSEPDRDSSGGYPVVGMDGETADSYEPDEGNMRDGRAFGFLTSLAIALAGLSVLFSLLPIIGRVLWLVPAVPAVICALISAFMQGERGNSVLACLVALVLVICAAALSFVADASYRSNGVIGFADAEMRL